MGEHVHRRLWTFISSLLLTIAACSHGVGSDTPRPADSRVRVEAVNRYALPIELFATGSGISHRLGTVDPGMTAEFFVPPNLIGGSVELQARSGTGQRPFSTGQILLAPGTIVDFVIASQLFNSTATLR